MYHTIHAANIHKYAVAGHGFHGAGIVLTHLDALPNGSLGSLTGLKLHRTDGTHHAAAGTVDLGDTQRNGLPDHLTEISTTGLAALGSGHEHAHALDIDDNAALVLLGDLTLQGGLLLTGLLDILPNLHSVQTLL